MALMRVLYRYLAATCLTASLIFVCLRVGHLNATTVALLMLLLVLGTATRWGLREAIFTSVLCVFAFNYFFLPPLGTLTIADPQNWVALTAFIVSAIVASQLSARAKSRAEEAGPASRNRAPVSTQPRAAHGRSSGPESYRPRSYPRHLWI